MTAHNRRAFRILFVGLVCVGMGQSVLFSTLPPAARALGLTPFRISTIFATSATLWVFASPWWGRRSDVVGRRPIILGGLLGYALSMALVATTITLGMSGVLAPLLVYPCLIASRCVFAVLGSGTGPASQAYVADRTSHAERTAGVAFLNAAMGLGETIGPGFGSMLAVFGLGVPLYFAAGVAVASAALLWRFLPEETGHHAVTRRPTARLRLLDRRVLPFLAIAAALQAVRATTTITLSFFFQDTLGLDAATTVRDTGIGFVVLAVAGLFSQLVLVQRLRPTARAMLRVGVPLMLVAFVILGGGVALGRHPRAGRRGRGHGWARRRRQHRGADGGDEPLPARPPRTIRHVRCGDGGGARDAGVEPPHADAHGVTALEPDTPGYVVERVKPAACRHWPVTLEPDANGRPAARLIAGRFSFRKSPS
jgi:MFS family permease